MNGGAVERVCARYPDCSYQTSSMTLGTGGPVSRNWPTECPECGADLERASESNPNRPRSDYPQ